MRYLFAFFIALSFSIFFTLVVKKMAVCWRIFDDPSKNPERKKQKKSIPLLGGLAIFITFNLSVYFLSPWLLGGYLLPKYLWGIFLGGCVLMIGGILDDKYNLSAKKQIIFPVLAVLIIISCGIGIEYISNPLGGIIYLQQKSFTIFSLNNLPYKITLLADIFTFIWLMTMMYTTKLLDGLDGLVSGITSIGSFVIFCLSLTQEVAQPETALMAVVLTGASLGFLIFNFSPAKIYLGEGGSLFTGFMLGVLAIISGGKIATALLILGIPLLDLIWVVLRRLFWDKKSPFKNADRKHLHFRLLDIGFSERQAVLFLYFLTIVFGFSSLFLKGSQKLFALTILILVMLILAGIVVYQYRLTKTKK